MVEGEGNGDIEGDGEEEGDNYYVFSKIRIKLFMY